MTVRHSHRITLTAKYHGPSNTKGSRIVVNRSDDGRKGSLTVSYDHGLDASANYVAAFNEFIAHTDATRGSDLGDYNWIVGSTPDGAIAVVES